MRLARVLEQDEAVCARNRVEPRHVGRLSVEVHGQERGRARRDRGFDRRRIDRQPVRIDVGEDGRRAGHADGQCAEGRRERRRDDFVARADAERAERKRDRVGAVADAHAIAGAGGGGEFIFECGEFGAENEPAARDHPIDRRANERRVLAWRQGHERHARRHDGRAVAVGRLDVAVEVRAVVGERLSEARPQARPPASIR